MRYLILDLETGIKEAHGRKGNPWFNEIVALGLKPQGHPADALYAPEHNNPTVAISKWLEDWLRESDIIIGHNIKFDLLYLWKFEIFQDWLLEGGRIWDTQLAEYMLTGQMHKWAPLRDKFERGKLTNPGVALKYGRAERTKHIDNLLIGRLPKNLKKEGITEDMHINSIISLYPELDKSVIRTYNDMKDLPPKYVLEDVLNDILDTEQVMLQQVKEAKKVGMFALIMEEMEGLLATTEMEFNGIYNDLEIMAHSKKIIGNELNSLHSKLNMLISKHIN